MRGATYRRFKLVLTNESRTKHQDVQSLFIGDGAGNLHYGVRSNSASD